MKTIRGGLFLSTLLFTAACEEESPPTSWDFTCEATWYRDNPQGGGTDTDESDAEPIGSVTLGPYEDLGSADEAVALCAEEQASHEDRPSYAFFYKCECGVGSSESE